MLCTFVQSVFEARAQRLRFIFNHNYGITVKHGYNDHGYNEFTATTNEIY